MSKNIKYNEKIMFFGSKSPILTIDKLSISTLIYLQSTLEKGQKMSTINDRIINNDIDNLSNVYDLANGHKSTLIIHSSTSMTEIYNEAVQENCFVTSNEMFSEYHVITIDNEPSLTSVVRHLLSHLQISEPPFVNYSGTHNIRNIRATISRIKDEFGEDFSVRGVTGDVRVSRSSTDKAAKKSLDAMLDNIDGFGKPFEIDLSLYPTPARLRAAIQTYSIKNGCKFRTRVEGDKLVCVKLKQDGFSNTDLRLLAKEFLLGVPYDVKTPINYKMFGHIPRERVIALLRYAGGKSLSFKDDTVTRHAFKVVKNDGCHELYHHGKVVYTTPSNKLGSIERASINTYLSNYGYVMVGRKIEKVTL